ncbi:MAG: M16 family metallopeptidase [Jatrophihabitans sp.]|uniref:M16 family metallopeptidase n=1 Tax=Jatrophihabitans sp. TaxID=1932789 RepID=UPI003F7D7A47
MTVPALTAPRRGRKLSSQTVAADNGLRIVAVRKPGVPLVEVRLRIPFLSNKPEHPARASVLSDTMATGAGDLDRAALASRLQGLGGDLNVSVDADRLVIGGNALATSLRGLLDVLALLVTDPTYAKSEVATERDRLIERLTMARARPGVVANEALGKRLWGEHPYSLDLPLPEDVAEVKPGQLRRLHEQRVRPSGATLVVVGDIAPGRIVQLASDALAGWTGEPAKDKVPALPTPPDTAPLLVIDRPGSVQSSIRLARPALSRTDEAWPALQLANLIFGGYFSSRWTENIREDKGYTYGPHSRVDHHVLGSLLTLDTEVATEVTAPAMVETLYELGRIASLPVTEAEVTAVRQYAIGTLALSLDTQAGLASTLSALSAFDLGLDYLAEHPARLAATTVDDVSAAAARFFRPAGLTGVVVGDAATIAEPLGALFAVEQQ